MSAFLLLGLMKPDIFDLKWNKSRMKLSRKLAILAIEDVSANEKGF
ncbi:hypothetical protein [Marivirga sp.]